MFELLTAASAGSKVNQCAASFYILRQQFDPFTMLPSSHFRQVTGLRPYLLQISAPDPAFIFFPAMVLECNISYYPFYPCYNNTSRYASLRDLCNSWQLNVQDIFEKL